MVYVTAVYQYSTFSWKIDNSYTLKLTMEPSSTRIGSCKEAAVEGDESECVDGGG